MKFIDEQGIYTLAYTVPISKGAAIQARQLPAPLKHVIKKISKLNLDNDSRSDVIFIPVNGDAKRRDALQPTWIM
jgi:hypothetical protein